MPSLFAGMPSVRMRYRRSLSRSSGFSLDGGLFSSASRRLVMAASIYGFGGVAVAVAVGVLVSGIHRHFRRGRYARHQSPLSLLDSPPLPHQTYIHLKKSFPSSSSPPPMLHPHASFIHSACVFLKGVVMSGLSASQHNDHIRERCMLLTYLAPSGLSP